MFHGRAVEILVVFTGECLEVCVPVLDFGGGLLVNFVEACLAFFLLVVFLFQLVEFVFLQDFGGIVVLGVGEGKLRIFGQGFGHLGGLGELLAGKCPAGNVNQDFVVLAQVQAHGGGSRVGHVAHDLDGGEGHFYQ